MAVESTPTPLARCSASPVCGLAPVLRLGRAGPSPFYQVPVHQGRLLPTLAAVRGSQAKLGTICKVTLYRDGLSQTEMPQAAPDNTVSSASSFYFSEAVVRTVRIFGFSK